MAVQRVHERVKLAVTVVDNPGYRPGRQQMREELFLKKKILKRGLILV